MLQLCSLHGVLARFWMHNALRDQITTALRTLASQSGALGPQQPLWTLICMLHGDLSATHAACNAHSSSYCVLYPAAAWQWHPSVKEVRNCCSVHARPCMGTRHKHAPQQDSMDHAAAAVYLTGAAALGRS